MHIVCLYLSETQIANGLHFTLTVSCIPTIPVMYMTFWYLTVCTYVLQVMCMMYTYYRSFIWHLTVSCIPAIGHVYEISIPDSFMYRSCIWHFNTWQFHAQVMYMTFGYLTVSCTGHVHDISIPDSFMYTCYQSCAWHWYLTVSCLMLESHWSLCYYCYYTCTSRTQNHSLFFIFHMVANDETDLSGFCFNLSVQLFSYCTSSSVIWLCSGIGS